MLTRGLRSSRAGRRHLTLLRQRRDDGLFKVGAQARERGVLWADRFEFRQCRACALRVALRDERDGQVLERLNVFGVARERGAKLFDGALDVARLAEEE